ncbi:hypothetical protein VN97_g2993 [Penicillium thymicola]|uniref:Uncharacterized protein n=1 Tax=Penicillium thymicola TaxID=293382 RepID=A0AAI9TN12_PENTH|nr:hypothetical protein VN97_g2993 [Penicillium thymicola]
MIMLVERISRKWVLLMNTPLYRLYQTAFHFLNFNSIQIQFRFSSDSIQVQFSCGGLRPQMDVSGINPPNCIVYLVSSFSSIAISSLPPHFLALQLGSSLNKFRFNLL